ncbi:hypothetical protein V1478_007447 [Vespula squamosa]|uniref:Uncharacterized protein n=1 Tax=Vespula squamosa TaxID=30214 RepID=A0ABD2B356_VESSQ
MVADYSSCWLKKLNTLTGTKKCVIGKAHDNGTYSGYGNEGFLKKWKNATESYPMIRKESTPHMEIFYGIKGNKSNS